MNNNYTVSKNNKNSCTGNKRNDNYTTWIHKLIDWIFTQTTGGPPRRSWLLLNNESRVQATRFQHFKLKTQFRENVLKWKNRASFTIMSLTILSYLSDNCCGIYRGYKLRGRPLEGSTSSKNSKLHLMCLNHRWLLETKWVNKRPT